jgi:uncharacterized protein YegL
MKYTNEIVEIVAVIDRSGSMAGLEKDVIGGFNTFLKAQQEAAYRSNLTLVQFDDKYEVNCDGADVKHVAPLNEKTYVPRGYTALLDALGRAINQVSARMPANDCTCETCGQKLKQKVIVAVITDGFENASREYNQKKIKELVESKQKLGWEFVFTMAGVDQFTAESFTSTININSGHTHTVSNTAHGHCAAYGTMTNAVSFYANGEDLNSGNYRIVDNSNTTPTQQ